MHLYACKNQSKCKLIQCPNDQLLNAIGVREGTMVEIVTRQPMGGPIVVRIGKRDIAIDRLLAIQIEVLA